MIMMIVVSSVLYDLSAACGEGVRYRITLVSIPFPGTLDPNTQRMNNRQELISDNSRPASVI